MTLISNWKTVLTKAWSIYAAGLIIAFSVIEQALPIIAPHINIPQGTSSLITGLLGVGVFALRLIDQQLGIAPPNV